MTTTTYPISSTRPARGHLLAGAFAALRALVAAPARPARAHDAALRSMARTHALTSRRLAADLYASALARPATAASFLAHRELADALAAAADRHERRSAA